jgi:DNA-binding response OmpR family regulator
VASIILVEDDTTSPPRLTDLLAAHGHTVRTADGEAEAIAVISGINPDLVIADLVKPDSDGPILIRRIRDRFPGVPVLVVTEVGSEELAVAALKAGASNYLPRRNVSRDLIPMLDDLLRVAHSQHRRSLFLKRMTTIEYTFVLESNPDLIDNLVSQVELIMEQMNLFDDADRMRVGVGIHEAAVNAMVHGNLEVSSALKGDTWDEYHRMIADRAKSPPYRDRRLTAVVRAVRGQELTIRLTDEGPGFDTSRLPDPTEFENLSVGSGRGMLLIRTFFDEMKHNARGNEITLTKRAGTTLPHAASRPPNPST